MIHLATVGAVTFGEFDEVLLTGSAYSPQADFVALHCTIATVGRGENVGHIKVWPWCRRADGKPSRDDPDGGGKIWFRIGDVTEVTILNRGLE